MHPQPCIHAAQQQAAQTVTRSVKGLLGKSIRNETQATPNIHMPSLKHIHSPECAEYTDAHYTNDQVAPQITHSTHDLYARVRAQPNPDAGSTCTLSRCCSMHPPHAKAARHVHVTRHGRMHMMPAAQRLEVKWCTNPYHPLQDCGTAAQKHISRPVTAQLPALHIAIESTQMEERKA